MLRKTLLLIATGYALVILLTLAFGLVATENMNRLHTITTDFYAHPFTTRDAALQFKDVTSDIRDEMLTALAFQNQKEYQLSLERQTVLDSQAKDYLSILDTAFFGDKQRLQELGRQMEAWRELRAREIGLLKQGHIDEARNLAQGSGGQVYQQISDTGDYVIRFSQQRAQALVEESENMSRSAIRWAWWLLGGLIAGSSFIGAVVAYRVSLLIRIQQQMDIDLRNYSAKLEASNQELESFSYSVSHDLRVPLRAVDGFSRILLEEYQYKLDAEGRRLLNVVRDNTKRMAQLIDDILAFSRTRRQEMTRTEVDMEALARDALNELQPALAGREVKVEVKSLPTAMADAVMIRRVYINLLSNAIKYTRPKTPALVEVGAISGVQNTEGETVYYVRDNGAGFDMKYVDKLFGMFMRLHGVEEFEGTGIGLAIVKRIITRHGGRVWAEGNINEGATFYFTLPP